LEADQPGHRRAIAQQLADARAREPERQRQSRHDDDDKRRRHRIEAGEEAGRRERAGESEPRRDADDERAGVAPAVARHALDHEGDHRERSDRDRGNTERDE